MKKRLDVLLVERGLAETRSQAQALVIAGLVPGYDKPGTQLDESIVLEVERPPRFVSCGGEKLAESGTSMAAPQATNLAAKMLAVNPKLTPDQVIRLIRDTVEKTPDGRRLLLNPARAVEAARKGQA